MIKVCPSKTLCSANWSPTTLDIKLSDVGSKLHPTKVSSTFLLISLSSPLLIVKLKVPTFLLIPEISYLKLSIEPVAKDPSPKCSPGSRFPV